jgi:serine O-acetyltransferase
MFNVVNYYRFSRWLAQYKVPFMPRFIDYLIRLIFSCWIPNTVDAGSDLVLGYGGLCIVIHSDAVIGKNVHIDQGVTIGGNATDEGAPVLGDNIYIGAGAKILGPIKIGDNSILGANAVIVKDVPARSLVVGVPGRIIKSNIDPENFLYHLRSS